MPDTLQVGLVHIMIVSVADFERGMGRYELAPVLRDESLPSRLGMVSRFSHVNSKIIIEIIIA